MVVSSISPRYILFYGMLCTSFVTYSARLIIGNAGEDASITYTTSVEKTYYDIRSNLLFVGAKNAGAQEYALSALLVGLADRVQSLAPEKVNLNNESDQLNPLYNERVSLIDSMDATDGQQYPILVIDNDPNRVYLLRNYTNIKDIYAHITAPLIDANLQEAAAIVGLVGLKGNRATSGALVALASNKYEYGYAYEFGDIGSGISSVSFSQETTNEKVCGEDGNEKTIIKNSFGFKQHAVTAFDLTSNVLKITSNVASLTNDMVMYWDPVLHRGYMGVQVVGANGAMDGARSLIVLDVQNDGSVILRPFAPNSAFDTADDQIIGGLGSDIPLSIHAIQGMHTSTGLSYLIVQGGNGAPEDTKRSVYALPIVTAVNKFGYIYDPNIQGTLADKDAQPITLYAPDEVPRLMRRSITTPATMPSQTTRSTDAAAEVGGGPIESGDIYAMRVVKDAVIVSVAEAMPNDTRKTGAYISKPIYDAMGKISAWTAWQRIGGTVDHVYDAVLSTDSGALTYLTGATADTINTIKTTQWGFGDTAQGLGYYVEAINELYRPIQGGVQGVAQFLSTEPGLLDASFIITTGFASVTIAQIGHEINMYESCPEHTSYREHSICFENGTITEPIPASTLLVTYKGGVLDDLGPITAATIATNAAGDQGFLFVGGSYGLAVLSEQDNTGWDTNVGLGLYFSGLTVGMSFKKLGEYTFIRKLIYDDQYVYVIHAKGIDRLDMSDLAFSATTIASSESLVFDSEDTILDAVISDKFGLIATSRGLFRIANDIDIRTIASDSNASWALVDVPGSVVPPRQLSVCSTTGREQDVARFEGGMIHLLSSYMGSNRARVNRFAVTGLEHSEVSDATILPLPDSDLNCYLGSFLVFNQFRTRYYTDGAISLYTHGPILTISPYVKTRNFRTDLPVPLQNNDGTLIEEIIRAAVTGSWIVSGDFGIRVNE